LERIDKRLLYGALAVFIVLLVGTNVINYLVFSGRFDPAPAAQEEPTKIIRYEPAERAGDRDFEDEAELFFEALNKISTNYFYPVETEELIEGAIRGMIDIIDDPQVRFYDPGELEEFLLDTRGSYGGLGIRIIEAGPDIVVFETFPGSPAERSGVIAGDRILEADGQPLTGEGLERAVELLRGPAGSQVEVKIRRPGSNEPIDMTVSREEIQITTVYSERLEEGLGYITITNFDSNTAALFEDHLGRMEQQGLERGLVLDLRNNPGGLLDQVVKVAQEIVPEGEIVRLVGRDEEVRTIYQSSAAPKPYPMVVLINEDTASSAELLAGALQDRQVALLVGQTTYGKASVQQLEQLKGENAIMLTVANYFTPSGHNIDKYGIIPDYEIEMSEILHYYRYFHPGPLEQEDYGTDVEMLQEMLAQLGYEVESSGYFDDRTARALSDFQVDAGIAPSGEFDDSTWVELREALDIASREQDGQLNFGLELLQDPALWRNMGGTE